MATLYELTTEFEQLYEMFAFNDDADMEEVILDTMEGIEGEFEIKAEGYAKIIKQLEADANAYKTEKERLEKLEKTATNKSKWLKLKLQEAMETTGKAKIDTNIFKISIQKNGGKKPLVFTEGIDIPQEYTKIKYELDNESIRKALDDGKTLDFVAYGETGKHIVIK